MPDAPTPKLPLRRLLALARPELPTLAVATLFLLVGSGSGLAWPQAIRWLIDGALADGGRRLIDIAALAMIVIFVLQSAAMALRYYLFTAAGERVVTRLRQQLYAAILRQEIGFFDGRLTGELTNRLSADTTTLQNTVTVNVSMALRSVVMSLGGSALLIWTAPKLSAVMLLVIPPVVLGATILGRRVSRISREAQDALADAGAVAEETIAGVRTVRVFDREVAEATRYTAATDHALDRALARSRAIAAIFAVSSLAAFSAVALVLWLGGRMVVDGTMTVGELTSFILYTLLVAMSISTLGELVSDFLRARGAAERVFELLDRQPSIPSTGGRRVDRVEGSLRLEGVRFAYPSRPDVVVLDDVDLVIDSGQVVALVGPSGAGKSTVASLLLRLYDPVDGAVLLDGVDLRELEPGWLRRRFGVVAQEPTLFSTSIRDNIRYGKPDADQAEVEAAARAANAHGFITDFPEGYDTLVGERGVQLSGGQRQRVAIARALLEDPAVLVLDEATSALDAESEHLVQEALERLMEGRTSVVIAHRLSTVKDADLVVVLDGGSVVERGRHEELTAADGVYARLVQRQLAS